MLDKKTPEEIKILREGGKKLGQILRQISEGVVVGNTGRQLNTLAEKLIKQAGAFPSFKNYQGFPAALCVSINDAVVHGIPTDEPFKEGDLVGIDLGIKYKGLYTDTAITVGVGRISSAAEKLLFATKKSLDLAISQLKVGGYIYDIGRQVHENPSIPNYYIGRNSVKIFDGMVIAIEPMLIINNNWRIKIKNNKWDVVSQDGSLTAHFEHSVAITQDGPI